jgi:hypothetical protein
MTSYYLTDLRCKGYLLLTEESSATQQHGVSRQNVVAANRSFETEHHSHAQDAQIMEIRTNKDVLATGHGPKQKVTFYLDEA